MTRSVPLDAPIAPPTRRPAFTLVELLVSLLIVSVLASLSLAAILTAGNSAKRSTTETTIRKINEVVLGQYETYLSERVNRLVGSQAGGGLDATTTAKVVLIARRRLMALEMPERLTDILCHSFANTADRVVLPNITTLALRTPLSNRYKALFSRYTPQQFQTLVATDQNDTAECLFVNVMLSGYGDPDIIMHFRDNEMGDTNKNGLREFVDAWGNPIQFLRWAPGFTSAFQPAPYSSRPSDPFDESYVDTDVFQPDGASGLTRIATRLMPLVISPGGDGQLGIKTMLDGQTVDYSGHAFDPFYPVRPAGPYLGIGPANSPAGSSPGITDLFGSTLVGQANEISDNVHSHGLSR
jgi:prepilin-type N-terminal cleavage/methylation domain-containing protein